MSTGAASGRLAALGDGYVRLWRRLLRSPLWSRMNPEQTRVWLTLLLLAEWKDRTQADPQTGKRVLVQRGEVLVSQRELADIAGVGRKVVRNALDLLSRDHGDGPFLTLRRGPKGVGENDESEAQDAAQNGAQGATHVSIVNFARYQDSDENEGPGQGPASGQGLGPLEGPRVGPTPYKKDEEEREPRARSSKSAARSTSSKQSSILELAIPTEAWALADRHRTLNLEKDPDHSCGTKRWSKRQWAQQYHQLYQDSPGADTEWWKRTADLLEYAYREAPPWRDGSPYWTHVGTPQKFIGLLDDLRRLRSASRRGTATAQQGVRMAIPQELK